MDQRTNNDGPSRGVKAAQSQREFRLPPSLNSEEGYKKCLLAESFFQSKKLREFRLKTLTQGFYNEEKFINKIINQEMEQDRGKNLLIQNIINKDLKMMSSDSLSNTTTDKNTGKFFDKQSSNQKSTYLNSGRSEPTFRGITSARSNLNKVGGEVDLTSARTEDGSNSTNFLKTIFKKPGVVGSEGKEGTGLNQLEPNGSKNEVKKGKQGERYIESARTRPDSAVTGNTALGKFIHFKEY